MAARSLVQIAVNVALDGGLAAASVPLAHWIAAPAADPLTPLWTIRRSAPPRCCWPALPFRLSLQYWRFAGIDGPADRRRPPPSSARRCSPRLLALAGLALPNPAFPVVHALTLLVLLGTPASPIAACSTAPPAGRGDDAARSVLLVGAGEDARPVPARPGPRPPPELSASRA